MEPMTRISLKVKRTKVDTKEKKIKMWKQKFGWIVTVTLITYNLKM